MLLEAFDSIKSIGLYPSGKILFVEGCASDGVYLLCAGRAKLSSSLGKGRQLRLRVAGPGEMLGLSAVFSGTPYEATAELLDNSQVAFVRREDLSQFLHLHREACLHVVRLLSQDLHIAYDQVRAIGFTRRTAGL